MESLENKPREHIYDETIKNLEIKDSKALAGLAFPNIDEADDILLQFAELAMTDMKRPDYVAKIRFENQWLILHMEFESNYKSNREMQKRMLRYYSYLYWNEELPIYQVVALLKAPDDIKKVATGINSVIYDEHIMNYQYKVIKLYEKNKYTVLRENNLGLYPLRIFMRHDGETDLQHIEECLKATEVIEDPDYYFLTVECGKKLYGTDLVSRIIKEAIYMSSVLYKHPYEKGKEDGIAEGMEKGEKKELIKTVTKLLTKKFGIISDEIREKIKSADIYRLELITENIFEIKTMDETLKYLGN